MWGLIEMIAALSAGPKTNGNGNGNGGVSAALANLPMWAKIISVAGPTAAIALYLVWVGAQTIPALAIAEAMNQAQLIKTQELLREHITQQQEVYRLMQRICVNTAKDAVERGQCFEIK